MPCHARASEAWDIIRPAGKKGNRLAAPMMRLVGGHKIGAAHRSRVAVNRHAASVESGLVLINPESHAGCRPIPPAPRCGHEGTRVRPWLEIDVVLRIIACVRAIAVRVPPIAIGPGIGSRTEACQNRYRQQTVEDELFHGIDGYCLVKGKKFGSRSRQTSDDWLIFSSPSGTLASSATRKPGFDRGLAGA